MNMDLDGNHQRWSREENVERIKEEEKKNFIAVIQAFKHYKRFSHDRALRTEAYLNTLPQPHQDYLMKYRSHMTKVRDCIETNHWVLQEMIKNVDSLFENENVPSSSDIIENGHAHASLKLKLEDLERPLQPFKLLKVQTTLKQIARDWSKDGELERQQCYQPIINEILHYYNPNESNVNDVKILVPGSGLGRLIYDLACLGYYCEGNEVSLFMLIASNFVLNQCESKQYTIYPYVHQYTNNLYRADQIQPVTFPDISPNGANVKKGTLRVAAGDFLEVYTEVNFWECVATCFFIDCANNIIAFIEAIYRILRPGGVWINLGPLLYHYADISNEKSIEPTFEDLLPIMKSIGFEVIKYETGIRTIYAQNPRSMLKTEYESIFWVCKKPIESNSEPVETNGMVKNIEIIS